MLHTKIFQLGETICDMHCGLPERTLYPENIPLETRSHVCLRIENSSAVLNALMRRVLGKEMLPTNKMAKVIGQSNDGWWQAAYSYDDRCFGVFEFRIPS